MKSRSTLISIASVAAVLFLWETASRSGWIEKQLLPPWTDILSRCASLLTDPRFLMDALGQSLKRFATAAAITFPLALILGIGAGVSDILRSVLQPFVNFTLPLPKVALYPFVLAVAGIDDTGKIVLIALGMFYPLFINVAGGMLRLSNSDLCDVIRVYKVRGLSLWWNYYLRGLTLDMITGLKAAFGYGFTLVVVSEMTASQNGIGNFIWRSWDAFQVTDMLSGIVILCLAGWIVQTALDYFACSFSISAIKFDEK